MDYKTTLNLPVTDFPMRASLPQLEPQILAQWKASDVYAEGLRRKKDAPRYTLHDGPPYANGKIHIGHALNKTLKDVVVKYKTLRGFHARMIPGWDCHGLPVELALLKDLKVNKDDVDQVKFREQAAAYATKHVGLQRDDMIRIGCWADWEKPYLTLNPDYEAGMLEVLAQLSDDGYIYRGKRPVNWCVDCHTALAEAEVEYADKESDSIYFTFKLNDASVFGRDDVKVVVWTTTPWTLFSNLAIAFNPSLEYVLAETSKGVFVFAAALKERLEKKIFGEVKILQTFNAKVLEKKTVRHPFVDRDSLITLADYVSAEDGSGCVHIAPGHGQEDFQVGKQYGLDVLVPIDGKGVFRDIGQHSGTHVTKMNPIVIGMMQENGTLLRHEKISHSYPHCWRCKKPLMFRATEQWFVNMEHKGLRNRILDIVDNEVRWVPQQGHERFRAMIVTRPDWCISRQRLWGVPIPALTCKKCGKTQLSGDFVRHLSAIVRTEGTNAYFSKDLKDLLPADVTCCGGQEFEKGKDILDVWFESGVSFKSVLGQNDGVDCPADLYLEGSDQHRGWFQVSMINAAATTGKAPYKAVLTHGFVVDGDGRKMSKSVGNVVAPQSVIDSYGAEILRLWAIFSDYRDEVRISDEILKQLADAYRKIRNTIRFLLGNLNGFTPDDLVPPEQLRHTDRYILSKLAGLAKRTEQNYDDFLFYKLYHDVHDFCNVTLSSFYLDITKDTLYTFSAKSLERRSVQTVLWHSADFLIKAIAPFLCFTAEQAYGHFSARNKQPSVFLDVWSEYAKYEDKVLEEKTERVLELRDRVFKVMEGVRGAGEIGASLEAQVVLGFKNENEYAFFAGLTDALKEIMIVSAVTVEKAAENTVVVKKAVGEKCPRCWNIRTDIGTDAKFSQVCPRCAQALNDMQGGQ
jgi:isoleucyl-tRNA synthetase